MCRPQFRFRLAVMMYAVGGVVCACRNGKDRSKDKSNRERVELASNKTPSESDK